MILELNKGTIVVQQNSIELKDEATIYLNFKDHLLSNLDVVKFQINGITQNQIKSNIWKIDAPIYYSGENVLSVIVSNPSETKSYSCVIEIKNYLSFGKKDEKLPQIVYDLTSKINSLEKRIKTLENKGTVV